MVVGELRNHEGLYISCSQPKDITQNDLENSSVWFCAKGSLLLVYFF